MGGKNLIAQQGNRIIFGGATGPTEFTLTNARISFQVSQTTVSLSLQIGALEGANFTDGQTLSIVNQDTPQELTGGVRVPNDPSLWTNAGDLITISGISDTQEATITAGVYSYTNVQTISGTPTTVFGSFGDWAPATAGRAVETIDQTRSRSVTTITPQTQTRTVNCDQDTCTGDARTSVPLPDLVVIQPSDVEMRSIPNPNFLEPFTFRDTFIGTGFSINRDTGALIGLGSVESRYQDAEGNSLTFTVALAPGETDPPGAALAIGAAPVEYSIDVVVTGETPTGFANEGTDFTLPGTISVTQFAPLLSAPVLSVRVTEILSSGLTGATSDFTSSGMFDLPNSDSEYRFNASSTQDGVISYSPPQLATTVWGSPGGLGRRHEITATNTAGSDTLVITVTTSRGGFQ